MCDCCGRRVAGGAGPHVLQRETGRKVSAGEDPALSTEVLFASGIHFPLSLVLKTYHPLTDPPDTLHFSLKHDSDPVRLVCLISPHSLQLLGLPSLF